MVAKVNFTFPSVDENSSIVNVNGGLTKIDESVYLSITRVKSAFSGV